MITARGLTAAAARRRHRRDDWGDDIIEALLPRIEPTLPLFPTTRIDPDRGSSCSSPKIG